MNLFWLLRKPFDFSHGFNGNPTHFIPEPTLVKGCFILKQMTRELMLVYSFINFVIPLPATNTRHSQDNC